MRSCGSEKPDELLSVIPKMKVLLIVFSRTPDVVDDRTVGFPPPGEVGWEGHPVETPGTQMSSSLMMNESGNVVS